MRKSFFFSLAIFICLTIVTSANAAKSALPSPNEVISLINQYRQQNGIPALEYNALLANLAQTQSNYQAQISSITHTGPGGTSPQERATAAGYGDGNWFYFSEIIYGGTNATPSSALTWWKNSGLHNSIMLDPKYTEIGAGVATDGISTYFTAELGGPTSGSGSTTSIPTQPAGPGEVTTAPTSPAILPVTRSTPGPDGAIRHIVLQGQTLWTIAAIYETTTDELIELNKLGSSYIFPGDDLLIQLASEAKSIQATNTPAPTQSLSSPTTSPARDNQPKLGTPFSLVLVQPSRTPEETPDPDVQPEGLADHTSRENSLLNSPIVNTLLIAAVVILVVVVLVSGFSQNKSKRPDRDDTVR